MYAYIQFLLLLVVYCLVTSGTILFSYLWCCVVQALAVRTYHFFYHRMTCEGAISKSLTEPNKIKIAIHIVSCIKQVSVKHFYSSFWGCTYSFNDFVFVLVRSIALSYHSCYFQLSCLLEILVADSTNQSFSQQFTYLTPQQPRSKQKWQKL